jgi:YHS domain-containing protein
MHRTLQRGGWALSAAAVAVVRMACAQDVPTVLPPPAPGATPALESMTPPERTMPVDAVHLRQAKSVPGDRRWAVAYQGNVYLFAGQETRDAFVRDPATFAAVDAGACGRMGPLGGLGDARRHALQDGLLYFFASDACMQAFRAAPKQYMEPYDQLPSGTPELQRAGLEIFDRWVAWAGGKDAVRRASTYRQVTEERVTSGGREWDRVEELEIAGPSSLRRRDVWRPVDDPKATPTEYDLAATPERTVLTMRPGPSSEFEGTRRTAFRRAMNRLPWAILQARFRPEAGLLVIRTGEGRLGDADCDYVATWFEGNLTNLAIDKSTGRLVQMGYVGRDTQQRVMSLTMDAVDHAGPEALRLPTQWVIYPTGEKEGTMGPKARIMVGPAASAPAAGPATESPSAPATAPAPATPAPAR